MITKLADEVLTYVELGDWQAVGKTRHSGLNFSKSFFNNCIPLHNDDAITTVDTLVDNLQFWRDATQYDLDKPLDVAVVAHSTDDSADFVLTRYSQVYARNIKGNCFRLPKANIIRQAVAYVDKKTGKITTAVHYYDSSGKRDTKYNFLPVGYKRTVGSGNYFHEITTVLEPQKSIEDIRELLTICCAMQFNQEFLWSVSVGWVNTPSIMFLCDPEGAKEALKLRQIPEGKKRRSAILHWVSGHWRKNSNTSVDEIVKVREHLRGSKNEVVDNFMIKIEPSLSDLKRVAKAIQDRKELKRLGLDRLRRSVK